MRAFARQSAKNDTFVSFFGTKVHKKSALLCTFCDSLFKGQSVVPVALASYVAFGGKFVAVGPLCAKNGTKVPFLAVLVDNQSKSAG